MRVLVTGGAGFIGSHVVDALIATGHEVVVLDRAEPPYRNDDAEYHLGDVRDERAWTTALVGVDAISHQAARVGLGVDFSDVTAYVADNDVGLAAGLCAMHRAGFGGRLILASSMVVYGEGRYRCSSHGLVRPGPRRADDLDRGRFDPACPRCGADLAAEAVTEDDPVDPRNVYAATKLHQEHLAASFAREHGTAVIALRYHNVYGSRMPRDTPYAGVAALFASNLAKGAPARVFEDGRQRRDFIHVADVARANVAALTAAADGFAALNLATGHAQSVNDLAGGITATFGPRAPAPVITGEWRAGDVRHVFASPARADDAIGWQAEVPLAVGLAGLFDGLRASPVGAFPAEAGTAL